MSTTVTSTATFGMDAFASLAVVPSASDTRGTITFTSAAPNSRVPSFSAKLQAKEFGPFLAPMTVSIVVEDGSCTYQLTGNTGGYQYDSSGNVTGLVGPDGALAARLESTVADKLTLPVEHFESTAAMSTTVTVRITPTATFRTARVSWVNNGASGTAKLNIAANCDNDVAGLVASQSALQRDAQMTMGDALLLISPVPITSLNFSSDGSITSDSHRLSVTFGA